MANGSNDDLAMRAAKLLKQDRADEASKLFAQMMTPESKAILYNRTVPNFGNQPLPDHDW
ncbi:MAG: hypothetical protein Q7S34_02435 [bacterium]|nr:hypothetical protein [bacterium]